MDPVTLIGLVASVTNLIHASRVTLDVIRTFKDGDKNLAELSKDITVFAEALAGFDRVLRSRATFHRISGPAIESVVEVSTNTIKDLRLRLQQISSSDISAVRRAKWVQNASKIERLHERLKEQNAMLQTFLSITHAETFLAVASQYPQFMLPSGSARRKESEDAITQDSSRLQVPQIGHGSRRPSTSSSTSAESTSEARSSMESLSIVSSATSLSTSLAGSKELSQRKMPDGSARFSNGTATRAQGAVDIPSEWEAETTLSPGHKISKPRQACRYDCYCKCHSPDDVKDRKGLVRFKSAKIQCTDLKCGKHLAVEKYQSKQSNSFREALRQAVSSKSIKVHYNLNTYRMVSEGSDAMRFVKHGNLEKLKGCFERGEATIWDTAPDGWSLLHTAAYNRQLPIVKYLLELGVDTEAGDVGSRKPADLAILKTIGEDAIEIEHNIVEIFSEKDDCLSDFEFTPIHIAVLNMYGPEDLERPSIDQLITVLDDANNAPANTDWAAWKRSYQKRSTLFSDMLEYFRASAFERPKGSKIIHNLLDRKDKKFHWTPLHWAASAGSVEKMKTLIKHGADPLLLSNLNASIIHAAAESKIGKGLAGVLDIWKHCSDQLNLDQQNRWAETPLHVAAWCSADCVRLLLEAGADPSARQEDGQVPLHCAGLSERGPNRRKIVSLLCSSGHIQNKEHINAQDCDGRPPLFDFLDDPECVKALVRHGARLDIADDAGRNIFHHACAHDEAKALAILLQPSSGSNTITEMAISKNHEGNTPLMEALSSSSVDCALLLLSKLDDVGDIISKDGWAAVHYAAKIGDADLLEAVVKHSSFIKAMRTIDGKKGEVVAMEAGNWHGKVKELIREHDYLGWKKAA